MNFIEELEWRRMLQEYTPGTQAELAKGMATGYIGFDPTAPSLTIGNYVQIMLLSLFQKYGHRPIFLLGGATGSIGDPSGKDKERTLKSYDELQENLRFQRKQAEALLDFDKAENKALMLNNFDFYKEMSVLDYLRDVGKNITVNYMLSKESVKKRLDSGISYTEFSYQVLQAYDFLYLYKKYNCKFQMGGSDQWGNITSGTEFIRKQTGKKAFAITTPLLTKADGSKFGKSEEGNIWLDPAMTSPYKFYQYWINASDEDLPTFIRYFTYKSKDEVEDMENSLANDPRQIKKLLAEELTKRIHGKDNYDAVLQVSELLFNRHASRDNLLKMGRSSLNAVSEEIPSFEIQRQEILKGINVIDLIAEKTSIVKSKGDARRSISNHALSINKQKVDKFDITINQKDLLCEEFIMIENGKKNKYLIRVLD